MFGAPTNPIQRFIARISASRATGDDPDRQLLERFVSERDPCAFEAIVERHGPLVLSVCTRVLGGVHDAEDAFQATFLVLVRKAGSIRAPGSLGPWLYGVAYRTALKAKAHVLKRQKLEKPLVDVAAPAVRDNEILDDLRAVLDEEVNCLPAKYRVPFVLCYMQGKTNAEAAQMLGCAHGTIFSRLAWARERLRKCLSRRLALASGAVTSLLTQSTVSEAVPVSYSLSTSKAALAFAAGKAAAAGTTSAPAAALAEGVLRAMFLTKLKIAIVVLFAIGTAGAGGGALAWGLLTSEQGNRRIGFLVNHLNGHGIGQPAGPVAGEGRTDKDKLQGTWILVEVTDAGKVISAEDIKAKNFEMVITGDKLTLPIRDDAKQVAYKLDPSKKPKEIDLSIEEGQTAKGIYSLEGSKLKLCVERAGGERPTEFAAPKDSDRVLMVLKKKP
jgi:RNA polymerase sigma factor (sigma-70 family)